MKDFLCFFVLPMIVAVATLWFSSYMFHDLYKSAIGYNIMELKNLKKECEKELPRNKVCIGDVTFTSREIK